MHFRGFDLPPEPKGVIKKQEGDEEIERVTKEEIEGWLIGYNSAWMDRNVGYLDVFRHLYLSEGGSVCVYFSMMGYPAYFL